MSATSTVYGVGVRYQTLGTGLSGTITSIDVAKMVNATYYNEFVTPILEECSSSSYSDCIGVTSSNEQQGISMAISSGIASYQTNQYTLNHCKYYRLALQFHSVGWGTGQLWFLGTTTDAYLEGSYADGTNILADIYFVLHGVDRLDRSANTPENICVDPVILIPGVLGTMWRNDGELLLDPILHSYDNLVATFEANGYVASTTFFTLLYDWRNSNVDTALLLKQKIDEVKAICSCNKVDIIAHSMGGLVARQYVESDGYQNDIDQVVFLATPHLGAPKAYLPWEAGAFPIPDRSDLVVYFLLRSFAKHDGFSNVFDYISKRPLISFSELLPVYDYKISQDVSTSTPVFEVYPNNYPRNFFVEGLQSKKSRLNQVRFSNLISSSTNSIGSIIVSSYPRSDGRWAHGEPVNLILNAGLQYIEGDGTVPISSASAMGNNEYIDSTHTKIVSDATPRSYEILSGRTPTTIIDNLDKMDAKFLLFSVLSPVNISITAPDGRRVGVDGESGEVNQIPGAFYSGPGRDEFIIIPNPSDGHYEIETRGTGDGDYTIIASVIANDTSTDNEFTATTTMGSVSNLVMNVSGETFSSPLALVPEIVPESPVATVETTMPLHRRSSSGGGAYRQTTITTAAISMDDTKFNPDTFMIAIDVPIEHIRQTLATYHPIRQDSSQTDVAVQKSQVRVANTASVYQAVTNSSTTPLSSRIKSIFRSLWSMISK